MSDFLPYAIIAGIVIVFFVVCYVLFAGGNEEKKEKEAKQTNHHPVVTTHKRRPVQQYKKAPQQAKQTPQRKVRETTAPVPKISTVTVRERPEHPSETAFVTTKGQVVRNKDGNMIYEAAPKTKQEQVNDELEITRVLSRDEILAAMEKVDKTKAADYKAREEEVKKEKEQQEAAEKAAEAKRIAADEKRRRLAKEQADVAHAQAQQEARTRWAEDVEVTPEKEPSLADMAAVVSADLAAREGSADTAATPETQAPKAAGTPYKRHSIVAEVMAENAKAEGKEEAPAPQAKVTITPKAAPVSDVTQIVEPAAVRQQLANQKSMADVASQLEQTQRLEPVHVDTVDKKDTAPEETIIMPPITAHPKPDTTAQAGAADMPKQQPVSKHPHREVQPIEPMQSPWGNDTTGKQPSVSATKARPSIWDNAVEEESPVVKQCVSHFLNQFGMVTPEMSQQAEYITEAAFQRVGCTTDAERKQVIMPLMAQEALQNVQKAYTAHPDEYVATLALQAFNDIIHGSPVSTRHLVAIDALKVMPYLSGYHYKILAILLIFLYSRNSHNVDTQTFRQYLDKYVMPFLDDFPTERSYYQQLDYLHCTAFESKETRFAEILSDSYPLLFRYRGITEEELRKALKGKRIPSDMVVQSFNSPLIKLAMVDDSMATRFFRLAGISDRAMQDHIMRLAKKRPASYAGEEALDIMEDISPVFADLSDIWDSTMLRVSTLSLLGLYLAQGYVHEMIGEEFDLSRWFD